MVDGLLLAVALAADPEVATLPVANALLVVPPPFEPLLPPLPKPAAVTVYTCLSPPLLQVKTEPLAGEDTVPAALLSVAVPVWTESEGPYHVLTPAIEYPSADVQSYVSKY